VGAVVLMMVEVTMMMEMWMWRWRILRTLALWIWWSLDWKVVRLKKTEKLFLVLRMPV
jgi:hypothetical protein